MERSFPRTNSSIGGVLPWLPVSADWLLPSCISESNTRSHPVPQSSWDRIGWVRNTLVCQLLDLAWYPWSKRVVHKSCDSQIPVRYWAVVKSSSLEVFMTWLNKALRKQLWSHSQHFEQEVGPPDVLSYPSLWFWDGINCSAQCEHLQSAKDLR